MRIFHHRNAFFLYFSDLLLTVFSVNCLLHLIKIYLIIMTITHSVFQERHNQKNLKILLWEIEEIIDSLILFSELFKGCSILIFQQFLIVLRPLKKKHIFRSTNEMNVTFLLEIDALSRSKRKWKCSYSYFNLF